MLHHMATILVCYGGHFESKMAAKIKNPPIWANFGLQVDYDAGNWYPNFTGMLSTMSRCAVYFWNFQNGRRCHGDHKKHEKCKVLGIGWNLIEMLYGMCINGFEALKFQNACRCHGNRKNTQFNTKVKNNLWRLRNFKMAAVAKEIIFGFSA